jgi:hypothetical protein
MRQGKIMAVAAVVVAVFLATVSVAWAQIETKAETVTAISGLDSPSVVGGLVLSRGGTPKTKPVGIVYVEAVGLVSVEATDERRQPVDIQEVTAGTYLVDRIGSTWVEVSEYGEVELAGGQRRKILLDRRTVVVVVESPDPAPPGPEPTPPPGPGPGPSPGPFDNIAAKVSQLSRTMDAANRQRLAQVLTEAADRMSRGQYLQLSQAVGYINANRPPCTQGSGCAELYGFMAADARTRTLSWQAAQDYYREMAKGLK